ncbi:MAG TPA: type II secretion system protein GspC [Steroidobacteraceae bacterium]|jgi:general secretion pathway protein C|nr:type II secretion system protein GspC [Steroidobacteraceae bacterium]
MSTISWLDAAGLPASGSRWAARAPQVAVWALAAALGIQAAVIVTHLAGSGAGPLPRGPAAPLALAPRLDLTALRNGHLFGAAPAPAPVNDANAPPTNMPLILSGIVASTDPKSGLAIIGTTPTNAKVYPVGERVPGNARVHAIYPDRVLLERNGTIEALLLPSKFTGGSAPALRPGPTALDRMQRVIANEPGLISDVLRPQPVFTEGKLRGYRVYPGRNARAFATLGLRNGDLVLSINGTALDDPARGNDIFSTLGNSDQARVTVMRNGQQQDITLNMSQIATQAEQISSAEQAAANAPGSEPNAAPQPEQPAGGPSNPQRPPRVGH